LDLGLDHRVEIRSRQWSQLSLSIGVCEQCQRVGGLVPIVSHPCVGHLEQSSQRESVWIDADDSR
jgi:hypothetical protein